MKKKEEISQAVPVKAELITALPVTQNKMMFIDQMKKQVEEGNLTYDELGRDLHLTDKQVAFCKFYLDGETRSHAAQSVAKAYGYNWDDKSQRNLSYKTANKLRNGSHPAFTLMQIMMDGMGANAANIDRNLVDLMEQRENPVAAVAAAKELNTVLNRNNKKVVEVNHTARLDYSALSDTDLKKLISIARKAPQIGGENV